ncbi:MAG: hypothetical protein JOZ17_18675, partial [Acetobacteraceae bacterium]|nr:hypothetical protein [Acetobacteraceae bacterium]
MQEAISQLRSGLELIERLPGGPDRWRRELDLQFQHCRAVAALKSIAAPAVGAGYARAHQLCSQLNWPPQTLDVLYGEFSYFMHRAELEPATRLADEIMRLGKSSNDLTLLAAGHSAIGYICLHTGKLTDAHSHLERTLGLLDTSGASSRYLFGHVAFLAWTLFFLGFVDEGRRHWDSALAEARRMKSLPTVAYVLTMSLWRLETLPVLIRRAEELVEMATEQGFIQRRYEGLEVLGW